MTSQPNPFLGANLKTKLEYWEEICTNERVIEWLREGVPLPIENEPQPFHYRNRKFSSKETEFIDNEVTALLKAKCIEKCNSTIKPNWINPINTVPKKNSYRLITDLRHLNSYIKPPKFTYEDINTVIEVIQPEDFIVTFDLKNGYFHIPVKESDSKYLCFQWKNNFYKWRVLPFGSNISPYYFCKVVRTVIEHFRSHDLKIVGYVDDFILCDSFDKIDKRRDWVVKEFEKLGWFLNFEKCKLVPSTKAQFLGYIIETSRESDGIYISIPKERITRVKKDIVRILKKGSATARGLARVAGQCISMMKAILPAKLLLRNLYRCLSKKLSWQQNLIIDPATRTDLRWWHTALTSWNGTTYKTKCSNIIQISTDASQEGWGGKLWHHPYGEAQGCWGWKIANESSNLRELQAVYLSLITFLPHIEGQQVQILTDNICTVAYINLQGGPNKKLNIIARQIWALVINNKIQISAKHLAGSQNVQADMLSRIQSQYEWGLNLHLFQYLDRVWGPHTLDRFASFKTTLLKRYNSQYLDPQCCGVDALAQSDWGTENNFVNAPIRLLDRILQVISSQKATATIIAPMWRAKSWCQRLRHMSIHPPIKLPKAKHFCVQKGIRLPEALKNPRWKWYAWRISGQ